MTSWKRLVSVQCVGLSTPTRLQSQMTYGTNGRLTTTMRPVTTTQQTILGKLLAPPKPRTIPLPQGEQMSLCFAIFLSLLFCMYGQNGLFLQIDEKLGENGSWVILGFLITFPILIWFLAHFVIFYEANQERSQRLLQEQERCQRLHQQWEQLPSLQCSLYLWQPARPSPRTYGTTLLRLTFFHYRENQLILCRSAFIQRIMVPKIARIADRSY